MANCEASIVNVSSQSHSGIPAEFTTLLDACSSVLNAKRYLHGEPQTSLYASGSRQSSPEVRAHWQACRILERASEKVQSEMVKQYKRMAASGRREERKREVRRQKEVCAAIDTLAKYAVSRSERRFAR